MSSPLPLSQEWERGMVFDASSAGCHIDAVFAGGIGPIVAQTDVVDAWLQQLGEAGIQTGTAVIVAGKR